MGLAARKVLSLNALFVRYKNCPRSGPYTTFILSISSTLILQTIKKCFSISVQDLSIVSVEVPL